MRTNGILNLHKDPPRWAFVKNVDKERILTILLKELLAIRVVVMFLTRCHQEKIGVLSEILDALRLQVYYTLAGIL